MTKVAAEQRARLAEVSRLAAAHAARKADDLTEARRRNAALRAQLTAFAEAAGSALDATAAASGAGLQVRAPRPGHQLHHARVLQLSTKLGGVRDGSHGCLALLCSETACCIARSATCLP